MNDGCDIAEKMAGKSIAAIESSDATLAEDIKDMETELNAKETELRARHMIRLNEKKCSPEFTVIYTDVIHDIEKIGDYCNNIAEAVIETRNN